MFIGLTALFLVMHFLQLSQYFYLRTLNGIIHISILWFAIREFHLRYPEEAHNYTPGVVLGMFTSTVGILPFAIFMFIFLYFNPGFLAMLQTQLAWGDSLTPAMGSTVIVTEGIVVSLISSYLIVRILEAAKENRQKTR
jgi:hypothetical protein